MPDADALLNVAKDRTEDSFGGLFFQEFSQRRLGWPEVHVRDMWANYLKVCQRAAGPIRFPDFPWIAFTFRKIHNEPRFNAVSAHKKAKQLAADGYEPVLKNLTWVAC